MKSGKVFAFMGPLLDALELGQAIAIDKTDADRKLGKTTVSAVASIGGSWALGSIGAKGGAALGAAIGTAVFPGVGTAIGGTLGGTVFGMTIGVQYPEKNRLSSRMKTGRIGSLPIFHSCWICFHRWNKEEDIW